MKKRHFTLEYWIDDDWYIGKLKEVPEVFSQGESLKELEENIQDAYTLMSQDADIVNQQKVKTKEIAVEVM